MVVPSQLLEPGLHQNRAPALVPQPGLPTSATVMSVMHGLLYMFLHQMLVLVITGCRLYNLFSLMVVLQPIREDHTDLARSQNAPNAKIQIQVQFHHFKRSFS